ncbi:Hypothetical protein; putative exported protein [Herminiimonas arsenicoxydans]|uniref:Uncharacterized protein n=1 Tax=Herminiimonas arsenicoxydans TaxID=204773 RepID=A4GAC6_HERAR|nr:Hypothetical protein; putative exported protein [Herminiimonas arsenicoxydans]
MFASLQFGAAVTLRSGVTAARLTAGLEGNRLQAIPRPAERRRVPCARSFLRPATQSIQLIEAFASGTIQS